MAEENKSIQAIDLLVLKKIEPSTGPIYKKNGKVLRVVQWVFKKHDGDMGSIVKLECRETFLNDEGIERPGKAVGLTLDEFKLVLEKAVEITAAMSNPKPVKKEDPDPEETPF